MVAGPVRRQRGLTFLGWALMLAAVGLGVYLLMKVFPIYMNQYEVASVLTTLQGEHALARAPASVIRGRLQKLFDVNDIDRPDASDAVIGNGADGARTIEVKYEVREPFTSQIDVVFKFDRSVVINGPQH